MSELICTCHCGGTMFYRHLHASDCLCATQGDAAPESHPDTIAALRATITQQAQELELVKERLATVERELAAMTRERDDAVDMREGAYMRIDGVQQQLAASQARCREMEREANSCADLYDRESKLRAQLQAMLAAVTAERDGALAEQAVLDAKYVDERAAKDSALAEVEQYYKCLQIEKGEHARALDERDDLTLTWTTEKPTVVGWYWYKNAVRLVGGPIVRQVTYQNLHENIWPIHGQWAGPIPLPKEAQP